MRLILIIVTLLIISSCKTTEEHCDAYSQNEIKKDHQI
jgi:hypothetical protein